MTEAEMEARIAALEAQVARLLVATGLRPDPAVEAAIAARERPKRSFEDMVMERTLRDHPTTRQQAAAMERAVPDGLVRAVAADTYNPRRGA